MATRPQPSGRGQPREPVICKQGSEERRSGACCSLLWSGAANEAATRTIHHCRRFRRFTSSPQLLRLSAWAGVRPRLCVECPLRRARCFNCSTAGHSHHIRLHPLAMQHTSSTPAAPASLVGGVRPSTCHQLSSACLFRRASRHQQQEALPQAAAVQPVTSSSTPAAAPALAAGLQQTPAAAAAVASAVIEALRLRRRRAAAAEAGCCAAAGHSGTVCATAVHDSHARRARHLLRVGTVRHCLHLKLAQLSPAPDTLQLCNSAPGALSARCRTRLGRPPARPSSAQGPWCSQTLACPAAR